MATKTKKQETLMKYLAQDLHLYEQFELKYDQTREFLEAKELQLKEELNDPNIISESAQKLTKVIQVLRLQIESLFLVSDDPTSSRNILGYKTTNGVIATYDEETRRGSQAVVSTHDEDRKLESLKTIFLKDPDQFEALKLVLGLRNQEEEEEVVKKKHPNWRWAFYGFVAKSTIKALLEIAKTYYNLDDLFGIEKSRKEAAAATTKNRADVEDVDAKKKRLETYNENKRKRKMKWMLEAFCERQREKSRKEAAAATTKNRADVEDVDAKKKMLDTFNENKRKRKMKWMLEAFHERQREKKLKRNETKRKRKLERMADAVAIAPDEREGKAESDLNVDDSRMIVPQMNVDEADVDVDVKKKIPETAEESKKRRKLKKIEKNRKKKLEKRMAKAVAEDGRENKAESDLNVDDSRMFVPQMNIDVNVKKEIPDPCKEIRKMKLKNLMENYEKRKLEKRMAEAVAVPADDLEGKAESDLNVDDSRMIVPQMNVNEAEVDVDVKKKIAETSKESKKKRKLKNLTEQRQKRKLEAVENAASDLNVDDSQIIVAQMNVYEADSDVNVKKNIPKSKKWSLDKLAEKRKKRLENRKARAMAKKEREDKVESDLNADDSQMIVAQMNVNEANADVNVKKKIPETSKEREEEPEQINGKEEVGEEMAQAVAEDEREDKVESDLNVDDSQMIVAQINVDEVDADINVKKKIQETSKEKEEEEPEQFKRQFKRKEEEEEAGEETQAVAEDECDDKVESVTLGGQTRFAEGKYNKREDDFPSLREYNDYLEEVEDMTFNLIEGIDVPTIEEKMAKYQEENAEQIVNSRARKAEELAAALAASKGHVAPQNDTDGITGQSSQAGYVAASQGQYAPTVAGGQPRPTGMAPQPVPVGGGLDMQGYAVDSEEMMRLRAERGGRAGGWSVEISKRRALEEAFASVWI